MIDEAAPGDDDHSDLFEEPQIDWQQNFRLSSTSDIATMFGWFFLSICMSSKWNDLNGTF